MARKSFNLFIRLYCQAGCGEEYVSRVLLKVPFEVTCSRRGNITIDYEDAEEVENNGESYGPVYISPQSTYLDDDGS